jgi:hypothetical protein
MRFKLSLPGEYYTEPLCSIRTGKPYPHYSSLRVARSVAHRWHYDKKVIVICKDVPNGIHGKTWTYDDCCCHAH